MKTWLTGLACLLAAAVLGQAQPTPTGGVSPDANPYAARLVSEPFQVVQSLRGIDPAVLAAFRALVPARAIAEQGEAYNATDVVRDASLPWRRFVLAGGHAPDLWFVLYEQGGRGYRRHLLVFTREGGGPWRLAAAASGGMSGDGFDDLKTALSRGNFHGPPDTILP